MRVRLTKFAAVVLAGMIMVAVLAPWLAPHDPVKSKPWDSLHAPSSTYWLGADRLGRDQLSRLIYGARVSLVIGIGGVAIAVCLGMFIGVTAGWYGGMWDEVLMRFMDGLSAFPGLLLALSLVAITGGSMVNIILVVGVVGTPWVARVTRSQVLSLREREFIVAVRGLGARPGRIMLKHLLPNCLAPVIVQASLSVAAAILLEAWSELPGCRCQTPHADLGWHAAPRLRDRSAGPLADCLPGGGDFSRRPGVQFLRGCAARRPRSQTARHALDQRDCLLLPIPQCLHLKQHLGNRRVGTGHYVISCVFVIRVGHDFWVMGSIIIAQHQTRKFLIVVAIAEPLQCSGGAEDSFTHFEQSLVSKTQA